MAYNVEQLQELQEDIQSDDSLDVLNAFEGLKRQAQGMPRSKPQRRNTFQPRTMQEGGLPDMRDTAQNLASKGRYGDTMLMHVTPDEVRGLSSLRGGVTINPETGLPEAFGDPLTMALLGAAIGGVGSAATGGDPIKGAILGGIGGFLPGAISGAAAGATTGLGGLWNWMGPIGQGMLVGGGMGGVRSLFGDSDNPLRDILFGAAVGGIGGAAFGEGPSFGGEAAASTVDASGAVVPMAEDVVRSPVTSQLTSGDFTHPYVAGSPVPSPALTDFTRTGLGTQVPTRDILGGSAGLTAYGGTGVGTGDTLQSGPHIQDFGHPSYQAKSITPSESVGKVAATENVPTDSYIDKIKGWWGRREPWEKAGMIGLGGYAALQDYGPPEQAPIPGLTTPSAIPEVGPFPFRTPIGGRDEEFYERTIGEGRTPEEAEYFTEEDINVAKEGGLVELAVGGNTSVFEGRVQGQGDGMADQVAFNVIPQTPADIPNTPDMALLSSDEYVVPADVVSMLGNGSSTAGAQALDQFNKLMRQKAHGTNKQQTEINPVTELSSLV